MYPPSYVVDSLSRSQDLSSTILSSSSPSQISSACFSIESFLRSHSPDQSRHFFSLTFPTLICKLFGFDNSDRGPPPLPNPGGWIDLVNQSNDPNLASTVFSLLSPKGPLFQLISAVDSQSLVKYVFPNERLPAWARFVKDSQVLRDVCPLFRTRVVESSSGKSSPVYQVQLNVFEYFVFWFAYYPICKANTEDSVVVSGKNRSRFKLENWTSSVVIPGLSNIRKGGGLKPGSNLYVRLLYAYLREFVPVHDLGSHHNRHRSSLLHYGYAKGDGLVLDRAEFFVDALVSYWLVDNDFSPLSVNVAKSYGFGSPPLLRSVLGESPPTPNLGQVVKLLVEYLSLNVEFGKDGYDSIESSRWSRVSSSRDLVASNVLHFGGLWNPSYQRPLYRYVLRRFLFCPVGTSVKNVSQVFSVWVSYLEPWKVGLDHFADLDALIDGSKKGGKKRDVQVKDCGYSSQWEGYVLSNYLYYSSLVMHFMGFAHKFLHTDPEVILQMVLQIVHILTSCKELTDLIKKMDVTFHLKTGSSKSLVNSMNKYVPIICEQLQDWEDGLSETDADGSFLQKNWNKDLKLFSDGEDGGQQLFQLFLLRAEAEVHASSGDNLAENLQRLDSLRAQLTSFFGTTTVKSPRYLLDAKQPCEESRDDIFRPRKVGNHAFADVRYKGDWMKRPISDDEVEWLAKLLVQLSIRLNEILGLNQVESTDDGPRLSYVEISSDAGNVTGPKETMKVVSIAISSWFLTLGAAILRWMRMHGLRVNLRMFASKKIVSILFVFAFFGFLRRAFCLFRWV